jgi:hypothetical protein
LHKQLSKEQSRSTDATLIILHEWNLLGVLELHFHYEQAAERAGGRGIQAVEEKTETGAGVAEVLLVNRLKTKIFSLRNVKKQFQVYQFHLLKDSLDRVTHHKVIVCQLQEHLPQSLLVVLEQSWIVVELRDNLAQVIQCNLFCLRLRMKVNKQL